MTERPYDAVIVGARCAGATLATLLARQGASVLLLDKDRQPSEHVLSTHTIHPPGMDVLDEVGVGPQVRAGAPAARLIRLAKNDAVVDVPLAEGRTEHCPRRARLDGLLQQAAAAAGADLRDRTRVTSLVEEDGRIAGVRAVHQDREQTYRARLVVGADGRHSSIAQLVGAEEYHAHDAPRGVYWSYWEAPRGWRSDPQYPFDMFIGNRRGTARVIFPTDDNQLLLGSALPVDTCETWRHAPLASLEADLASDPLFAPLMDGREPTEPVRGTLRERYFFRRAAGPGWALVGDAGHHKDFLIGDGITEALLQARTLATAIGQQSDRALERWWRQRDVEAWPYYCFGDDEGRAGPPLELQTVVFSHVNRDPALRTRFAQVVEHQVSPYEAFPISRVLGWTLAAALRGRVGVVRDFLQMGRRGAAVARELDARKKLIPA